MSSTGGDDSGALSSRRSINNDHISAASFGCLKDLRQTGRLR